MSGGAATFIGRLVQEDAVGGGEFLVPGGLCHTERGRSTQGTFPKVTEYGRRGNADGLESQWKA